LQLCTQMIPSQSTSDSLAQAIARLQPGSLES